MAMGIFNNLVRESVTDLDQLLGLMSVVRPWRRRLRLFVVWLVLIMKLRLGIEREWSFMLEWQGPRSAMRARLSDLSELWVLHEIFVSGEYRLPDCSPRVIVDLGSNIGLSVLYFRDMYPEARIIAVEADPLVFARLQRNVAHLRDVALVHAAAGDRDGSVTFYSGPESWAGSVNPDPGRRVRQQLVPALTLEDILERVGEARADLLKMDVEGSEIEILRASTAARNASLVVFEFHQEYADKDVWDAVSSLPEFEIVRMVGDSAGHPLVTLRRREAAA
jgi:FkbM family methyltransferase